MTQGTASLDGVWLKIKRAKDHLRELEVALERFAETEPHEVVSKLDPETGGREQTIGRLDPLPDCLGVISGDLIHNLRSALDHLVWQLVIANGGKPEDDPKRYAFPFWDAAHKASFPGKATGVSKPALKIIEGLKPYKGGNDALWSIDYLDVVDKHRLLLTVAASTGTVTINPGARFRALAQVDLGAAWAADVPDLVMTYKLQAKALHVGMFLSRSLDPAGAIAQYDSADDFAFDVALSEPRIGEPKPLAEALKELIDLTEGVVGLFAAEIC